MTEAEWWDLLDDRGRPTGETFRRDAPNWPDGRFHLVAATCVIGPGGRVLLTRRAATKEYGLRWEFPGGSALVGETSAEAARRELREETGLSLASDRLALVGRHTETSAFVDLYTASVTEVPELRLDPNEVSAAEWTTLEEVRSRLATRQMADPWLPRLTALWAALVRNNGAYTTTCDL